MPEAYEIEKRLEAKYDRPLEELKAEADKAEQLFWHNKEFRTVMETLGIELELWEATMDSLGIGDDLWAYWIEDWEHFEYHEIS